MDLEQRPVAQMQLVNTNVRSIAWRGVTVTVNDRKTKQSKTIVDNVEGIVNAGECCALMGPSGSGKTTLLNVLARRPSKNRSIDGNILVNGSSVSQSAFRKISCFVEQQDALIGALTVSETLAFTSRLTTFLTRDERLLQINALLESFGLVHQADTIVGTSLRKGISDGQKRRLAVARQLVTSPKILFLDEPTSGLDSAASFEVVQYLRASARRNNLIVICSVHQPSTSTINLFDKLLLVAAGKPHYFGAVPNVYEHYRNIGVDIPQRVNPTDFLLELVNTDFAQDKAAASRQLHKLQSAWQASAASKEIHNAILRVERTAECLSIESSNRPNMCNRTATLLHRSFVKSYRDPMAYGIRLAFSISFAFMTGTVWIRLDHSQESIQSLISELYFTTCFISLSAIIYGPAFIEDYIQFVQDFRNGLYDATEFALSSFLISIPYLFLSSLVFSVICYWLSNLLSSFTAFSTWVLWIFLTSAAAEALVVFVVSIFPDFMFTIAFASFLNSLLLCTQGFYISYSKLNAFYRYSFYYWNYLAYSFQELMINQFSGVSYSCNDKCHCIYDSALASQCQIAGEAVLDRYGYARTRQFGRNVSIMIAITLGYRLASWILLRLKN